MPCAAAEGATPAVLGLYWVPVLGAVLGATFIDKSSFSLVAPALRRAPVFALSSPQGVRSRTREDLSGGRDRASDSGKCRQVDLPDTPSPMDAQDNPGTSTSPAP